MKKKWIKQKDNLYSTVKNVSLKLPRIYVKANKFYKIHFAKYKFSQV